MWAVLFLGFRYWLAEEDLRLLQRPGNAGQRKEKGFDFWKESNPLDERISSPHLPGCVGDAFLPSAGIDDAPPKALGTHAADSIFVGHGHT